MLMILVFLLIVIDDFHKCQAPMRAHARIAAALLSVQSPGTVGATPDI